MSNYFIGIRLKQPNMCTTQEDPVFDYAGDTSTGDGPVPLVTVCERELTPEEKAEEEASELEWANRQRIIDKRDDEEERWEEEARSRVREAKALFPNARERRERFGGDIIRLERVLRILSRAEQRRRGQWPYRSGIFGGY